MCAAEGLQLPGVAAGSEAPDAAGKSAKRQQTAADNRCWSLQCQAMNCGLLPHAELTTLCSCSKTMLSTCQRHEHARSSA